MTFPHNQRQMFLEGVRPLRPDRDAALRLFDSIIQHFEPSQTIKNSFIPVTLIRLTKEEVLDKDSFINLFFPLIEHYLDGTPLDTKPSLHRILPRLDGFITWTTENQRALGESLAMFASFLIDGFFLPLIESADKRYEPAQTSLFETLEYSSPSHRDCYVRDRYRCVVTGTFDTGEAYKRLNRYGDCCRDDNGDMLWPDDEAMEFLKVAHIVPHALMSSTNMDDPKLVCTCCTEHRTTDEGQKRCDIFVAEGYFLETTEHMQMTHRILNMFNPTVVPLICGTNIGYRPMNALTMTRPARWLFSQFRIAFEHIGPHIYKIDLVRPDYPPHLQRVKLPVTRTLDLAPDHDIDPPSASLLKIHSAVAKIFHLSDVGRFIDRFFRAMGEMEAPLFKPDATSRFDEYVAFNLAGCFKEMSTN